MSTTLSFRDRLPGVECSPALPAGDEPVRLDVAGFVGFAERGPLDLPVAVEDPVQYAAVFGGDLALAQDAGEPVYAQLPLAVRSFFDNGGRRCHVVRVAGRTAVSARWVVPGLQVWRLDGTVVAAVVEAAWPGAWSSGLSLSTTLLVRHLLVTGSYVRPVGPEPGRLPVARSTAIGLQSGDVLELNLGEVLPRLLVRVAQDRAVATSGAAEVLIDLELAQGHDGSPAPAALASLPGAVEVRSARSLRFDLVVRRDTSRGVTVVDRLNEVSFGPAPMRTAATRPSWWERLQPYDDHTPLLDRSLSLRQDEDTMLALASGIAVPVGMSQGASDADSPSGAFPPLRQGGDGLELFERAHLADPLLAQDTVHSLLADADHLTVLARDPVRLRGIHALLSVDEVAVVAVPDATHRSWSPVEPVPPPPPAPPPEREPVDWSAFRCCDDEPAPPPPPATAPAPTALDGLPALDPVEAYVDSGLLDLQTALVVMCAARADQVALLSVPRHYDVPAVLDWAATLTGTARISDSVSQAVSPLSFAGLWHPWLSVVTGQQGAQATLRDVPPDGAVAGMVAARERHRGTWVAPAGVPLRGVVRLAPPRPLDDADELRLFDARANLVRRRPGVFTTLSAHTLTGDPGSRQLSVRRLLILLRKICLRVGARYVFEVNNDQFRQLVRLRFDDVLADLLEQGALHAFRVVMNGDVNTVEDQDAGRLVVALQVAPTSPVEFITVTLRRTGEGLLDVVEG